MKVLIDARMIGPKLHGIARYTLNLVKGLFEIEGLDVSLIVCDEENQSHIEALVGSSPASSRIRQFIRVPVRFAHPLESGYLYWHLRRHNFDVVHFTSFAVPLFPISRMVLTVHDLIHLKTDPSRLKRIYFTRVFGNCAQKSERIICVSHWTYDDLSSVWNQLAKKCVVIPNGLDESWGRGPMSSRSNVEPYFLCVSNTKPYKNVITLIRACELLWRQGFEFKLYLVVGTKTAPSSWELDAECLKRISWLEPGDDAQLAKLYQGACALVSPSEFEGYNLPAAEAEVLGVPTLLSKTSAHLEFTGSLVQFYEPFNDPRPLAELMQRYLSQASGVSKFDSAHRSDNIISANEMARRTSLVYEGL